MCTDAFLNNLYTDPDLNLFIRVLSDFSAKDEFIDSDKPVDIEEVVIGELDRFEKILYTIVKMYEEKVIPEVEKITDYTFDILHGKVPKYPKSPSKDIDKIVKRWEVWNGLLLFNIISRLRLEACPIIGVRKGYKIVLCSSASIPELKVSQKVSLYKYLSGSMNLD